MLNTINKFGQVSEDAVDSCDIKYLRNLLIKGEERSMRMQVVVRGADIGVIW
ncbi:MAG: hypothetical protein IPO45_18070 [Saprospiraceae bacterium]|uniref:hypothetical protein n=1 Tax=Candidatus Brachybacter algidus TaxID=2982024 RepID=UPI001B437DF9|nr:hypothetical protein [Candidatus Brachybacter algidus]MBP7304778.1 hypothetical protein [Saprospiraceae bacterium]MBK6374542.1 hypothetical protein [Candidatus Brachybacter algidus]MBK6449879.1 hypothetical protein [Candidatus Brachybacter algidus]MBK7604240.1 hypothetical protein [Candidatus Brachybacter algidus]MBK8604456.1 hypothetical protein [Candidatus Brachybacter algidus]